MLGCEQIMKKEYRNSTRTKKMIRSAFVDLIDEKKVISGITVAELAERADIAKSTFYNHYEDVYAVADEMMRELVDKLESMIDEMEADKTNDYRIYIKGIFGYLKENADIYSKVADSPDAVFFIDKIKRIVIERVLTKIKSPYLSKIKTVRQMQITFVGNACVDTVVDYFRGNLDMTFDELEKNVMLILERII